jgi:hypothetical protein
MKDLERQHVFTKHDMGSIAHTTSYSQGLNRGLGASGEGVGQSALAAVLAVGVESHLE